MASKAMQSGGFRSAGARQQGGRCRDTTPVGARQGAETGAGRTVEAWVVDRLHWERFLRDSAFRPAGTTKVAA